MKKSLLLLSSILCLSLSGCVSDPKEVTFVLNNVGQVDYHTDVQKQFWADDDFESSLLKYGNGENDLDKPNPIHITFDVKTASKYTLNISENEDMSNPLSYTSKKKYFDVYNLEIGTKYYYSVTAKYSSKSFTSEVSSFETLKEGPRNLYVEGVNNIRDIGGFNTSSGKVVKQGLIYRSAKMNESDVSKVKNTITKNGINVMINELGIKTDIDLRKTELKDDGTNEIGGLTESPLGKGVNYVNCPMYYEGSAVIAHTSKAKDTFNKESIKKMFDVLGDRNNYPLVFHCTQGKDRTGALAYLMETVLGMEQNDIYHDYLFTNLSKIGGYCAYKAFSGYDYYLNKMEGQNLEEKAYNYLLSIGVSKTTIDNFIDIMLG